MDDATYRRLYPTGASPPKFYGLPKVHKSVMPLRPIVSSIGSVTYETSKELSRILKPLVGRSPHHVQNNQEFLKQLEHIKLGLDDIIMSYDVKAVFTLVPINPALKIIQKLLEEDQTLPQRTTMTVNNITYLLEFCLTSTYFTFQEKFYEQVEGAAMGSSISPIVANLYMEDFEMKSLKHSTTTSIDVEKICWWHMCHHQSSSITKLPESHQFHWQEDSISIRRAKTRWIHTISAHIVNNRCRWKHYHICL